MAHIANHDIWSEILRYFQISFDESVEDIHLKRRAMFSAALTCKNLTEVALDELWRSMTTLEPLSRVLNASSTSSTRVFHYQGQHQDQGFWDITASADELVSCAPRLRLYLSRIHYLHFASFPSHKELVLWKALLSLGRVSSLCPNLKELFLDLENVPLDRIYDLSPLISNSAERIAFANSCDTSGEVAASLLLQMFRHYDAKVLEVSYNGSISTRVFHHILGFPSLRAATLHPFRHNELKRESYITSFRSPSHLSTLDIYLDLFSQKAGAAFGLWLSGLEALSTLRISGSWSEIRNCVFNQRIFHSLRRLSLIFTFSSKPKTSDRKISAALFHLISSTFPSLNSILLEVENFHDCAWNSEMTIQDVMELKGKPMESIDLRRISITLSMVDFISIIDTWHTLKQLSIVPAPDRHDLIFEADLILSYISMYGMHLRSLALPLDFSSLFATSRTATLSPCCPLQRLELLGLKNFPESLQGKHLLALKLLHLFPLLAVITSPGNSSHAGDLQVIIRAFQTVLASPPKKLSPPI